MKRLLLLEDSDFQRKILVAKLSKLDVEIRDVACPQDALIYLEAQEFDIVVTDLNLPEMSGKDFIIELRKFNKSIPVVGITSADELGETEADLLDAGANLVLKKPLESVDSIKEFLTK